MSEESEPIEPIEGELGKYDLLDLAKHLNIKVNEDEEDTKTKNNELAEVVLNKFTKGKYVLKVDKEIPSMSKLPNLYASTNFRPDITFYKGKKLISAVEVHSGDHSNAATLNKCIFAGIFTVYIYRYIYSVYLFRCRHYSIFKEYKRNV